MSTGMGQDGPFKEFTFDEWLKDGLAGMRRKMKRKKQAFNIANFRAHMRQAQKEQLLAVRSLIDGAIDCLETEKKAKNKAK